MWKPFFWSGTKKNKGERKKKKRGNFTLTGRKVFILNKTRDSCKKKKKGKGTGKEQGGLTP